MMSTQPYKILIDAHKDESGIDYEYEVQNIIFDREELVERLSSGKLRKKDRETLILLLDLLTW